MVFFFGRGGEGESTHYLGKLPCEYMVCADFGSEFLDTNPCTGCGTGLSSLHSLWYSCSLGFIIVGFYLPSTVTIKVGKV